MNSRVLLASTLTAVAISGLGFDAYSTALAMETRETPAAHSLQAAPQQGLRARIGVRKPARDQFVLPVDPETGAPWYTGNIVVKFRDDVRARASLTDSPAAVSDAGVDVSDFQSLLAQHKLTVRQWITKSPERLAALEQRARNLSGRDQPDLAGMLMIESVDPAILSDLAWTLNNLPAIEFAWIERVPTLHQCGPDAPGPCNVPGPSCDEGFDCNPDPGDQFDQAEYGCQDQGCCEIVTAQIPYCNDEDSPNGWDVVCAAYANILCNGTIYDNINPTLPPPQRYDPCFSADGPTAAFPEFELVTPIVQLGSCFEATTGRGCSLPACCAAVCTIDPSCCNISWDQGCVNLASSDTLLDQCTPPGGDDPTPSFDPVLEFPGTQGTVGGALYTQGGFADPEYIQVNPEDPMEFPGSPLTTGEGLQLQELADLQVEIASTFQNNGATLLYGESIKVAVIEFSAFVNHEDFTIGADGLPLATPRVIPEPNQSIILYEGSNNAPQHGTATLGQIVAADNGFGVTGIAKNAQGYFFPIVSFEEGSRPQNAILSCFEVFGQGDVVNHSWGFGAQPIPTSPAYALLLAQGRDLGITTVVSAGNSNTAIDPQGTEEDTDVIIVGACTSGRVAPDAPGCPGFRACEGFLWRLPFSNYSGEGDLAAVHVSAWGHNVVTVGYGDLFKGNNPTPSGGDPQQENNLRTYTRVFNGTSSAAPIISGAAACLQGAARQIYGTPIAPGNIRSIMSSGSNSSPQCPFAVSPIDEADCCLNGDPDCDGEFREIGPFPLMFDCGVGLFTGVDWGDGSGSGNGTQDFLQVVSGVQPSGAVWNPFVIRQQDNVALRIETVRRRSGDTYQGLTYVASGATTDVLVRQDIDVDDPATELFGLGVQLFSRATRPQVFVGAFAKNFRNGRYEFIDTAFIQPGPYQQINLVVNPANGNLDRFVDPDTSQVEMRVWTCGLGATAPHEVAHDVIRIITNDNTQNPEP